MWITHSLWTNAQSWWYCGNGSSSQYIIHYTIIHYIVSLFSESKSDPRCDVPDDPMSESFSCSPCKKVFQSCQALLVHQFRKHEIRNMKDIGSLEKQKQASAKEGVDSAVNTPPEINTRTFSCSVCSQLFTSQQSVTMHVRVAHKERILFVLFLTRNTLTVTHHKIE